MLQFWLPSIKIRHQQREMPIDKKMHWHTISEVVAEYEGTEEVEALKLSTTMNMIG